MKEEFPQKKEYTEFEIKKMKNNLRKKLHPDKGGDAELWLELNKAIEKAENGYADDLVELNEKIIIKDGDIYSKDGEIVKDSVQLGKNLDIKT